MQAVLALHQGGTDAAKGVGANLLEVRQTYALMGPEIVGQLIPSPHELAGTNKGVGVIALLKIVGPVFIAVMKRLFKRRGHGVYGTVVEEIYHRIFVADLGEVFWDEMKRMGRSTYTLQAPTGPGMHLCDLIETWSQAKPNRKLTIIGHSAGAILTCSMLTQLGNRAVNLDIRVVWMAAACTWRLWAHTLEHHGDLVSEWTNIALEDKRERRYHEFPVFMPYSLLYAISGLLEPKPKGGGGKFWDPHDTMLVGMERSWANRPLKHPPALSKDELDVRNRVMTLLAGKLTQKWWDSNQKLKHGDFDNTQAVMTYLQGKL